MRAGCKCGRARAPTGLKPCTTAFVANLPVAACGAIHGRVHQIFQGAQLNCSLRNPSAFDGLRTRTSPCVIRPNRPPSRSTDSGKKCVHLPRTADCSGLSAPRRVGSSHFNPDRTRFSIARRKFASLEIFFRNWMLRTFVLPINGHNPPASAVVEQLDTVDPAHERFGIVRVMT
jgi:hypothetical protein